MLVICQRYHAMSGEYGIWRGAAKQAEEVFLVQKAQVRMCLVIYHLVHSASSVDAPMAIICNHQVHGVLMVHGRLAKISKINITLCQAMLCDLPM